MIINKTKQMANNKTKNVWTKKTFTKKKSSDSNSGNLMQSVPYRRPSASRMESPLSKGASFLKKVTISLLVMGIIYMGIVFYIDNYVLHKNKPFSAYLKEISAQCSKLYEFATLKLSSVKWIKLDEKVLHDYLLMIVNFLNVFLKFCFDYLILGFTKVFYSLSTIIKQIDKNSPMYIEQFTKITNTAHKSLVDFLIDVSNYVKNKVFV